MHTRTHHAHALTFSCNFLSRLSALEELLTCSASGRRLRSSRAAPRSPSASRASSPPSRTNPAPTRPRPRRRRRRVEDAHAEQGLESFGSPLNSPSSTSSTAALAHHAGRVAILTSTKSLLPCRMRVGPPSPCTAQQAASSQDHCRAHIRHHVTMVHWQAPPGECHARGTAGAAAQARRCSLGAARAVLPGAGL